MPDWQPICWRLRGPGRQNLAQRFQGPQSLIETPLKSSALIRGAGEKHIIPAMGGPFEVIGRTQAGHVLVFQPFRKIQLRRKQLRSSEHRCGRTHHQLPDFPARLPPIKRSARKFRPDAPRRAALQKFPGSEPRYPPRQARKAVGREEARGEKIFACSLLTLPFAFENPRAAESSA